MGLEQAVAIVTGAAQGIGYAVAQRFGARGAKVVVADRSGADAAAERLRAQGIDALGVAVDVSQSEQVESMAAQASGQMPA